MYINRVKPDNDREVSPLMTSWLCCVRDGKEDSETLNSPTAENSSLRRTRPKIAGYFISAHALHCIKSPTKNLFLDKTKHARYIHYLTTLVLQKFSFQTAEMQFSRLYKDSH